MVTSIPLHLSCISGLFTPNKSHAYTGLSSNEPSPSSSKPSSKTLNNNILWSSNYNMGHLRRTIVEISSAQNCSPHTCIMCDHNNGPTMIRVGNHHKFKFNKANHNNVPTMIRGQQSPLKFTGYITKIHKNFNTF